MAKLNEAQRTRLLEAHAESVKSLDQLEAAMQENVTDEDVARVNELADRINLIEDHYQKELPTVPLSRCPFSGQVSSHSFDASGFDGLWWQYHQPVRPETEPEAGPYFLALTGAVRVAAPPEVTPFLVAPGPDTPYIIPRVLQLDQVRAVISMIGIGRHRAAAIVYFANRPLLEVPLPTIWGTAWRSMDIEARPPADDDLPDLERDFDFELTPWVSSGRLLWIAPEDASFTLRQGMEGCPYLQVPGQRKIQMIQNGKHWTRG